MNLFRSLRERFGRVIWVVIGSIVLLGCGLLFALILAPQQKLEARRIERLPMMDATTVTQAAAGDELLITGRLVDNPILLDDEDFVVYQMEEWVVSVPEYDPDNPNQEPDGDWDVIEIMAPDLWLDVNGQVVSTLRSDSVTLSGSLRESLIYSEGHNQAQHEGEWLPEGSLRIRGFYNADLVTVWGKKAATDGVIPDELFAGDRVTFVESKHEAAKGLLIAGISMLVCLPVMLIGGILSAIFGRRRR